MWTYVSTDPGIHSSPGQEANTEFSLWGLPLPASPEPRKTVAGNVLNRNLC